MVRLRLKAIVSNVKYSHESLINELRVKVKRIQEGTRREYQKTVATWDKKPTFFVKSVRGPLVVEIYAGTDDKIYSFVDEGTDPHTIEARNVSVLRYNVNYVAKTQVGVLKSRAGGFASEGSPVFSKQVKHPGTEARGFTQLIAAYVEKRFALDLAEVVDDWATKQTAQGIHETDLRNYR